MKLGTKGGEPRLGYNVKSGRGVAQFGSALASGARGPEFKSRRPDHSPQGEMTFLGCSRLMWCETERVPGLMNK